MRFFCDTCFVYYFKRRDFLKELIKIGKFNFNYPYFRIFIVTMLVDLLTPPLSVLYVFNIDNLPTYLNSVFFYIHTFNVKASYGPVFFFCYFASFWPSLHCSLHYKKKILSLFFSNSHTIILKRFSITSNNKFFFYYY